MKNQRSAKVIQGFNTQPPEGGWPLLPSAKVVFMKFQHAAARRRLVIAGFWIFKIWRFQHAAARRRLDVWTTGYRDTLLFQHAAARRRLALLQ